MAISGKVVIVTGGSKGIGKAIALRAATEGASVVINYLSDVEAANSVVEQIGPDRALAVQADVSRTDEITRLIEATVARFTRIDVLIPNAAFIPECQDLRSVTEDDFDRAFAVNVKGPCFLAQVIAQALLSPVCPGTNQWG
jgi:3-oxoacyl-[acyl-carrier protein] reductase